MSKVYNIVYLLDNHTRLSPYEALATDEFQLKITKLTTKQLDDTDEDAVGSPWDTLREADFILLLTHGGLGIFRKFDRFKELFIQDKYMFISTGIEDEMSEVRPLLRITVPTYLRVLRYVKCRDEYNNNQLHRFLASEFGGYDVSYDEPKIPEWDGLYLRKGERPVQVIQKAREARALGQYVCGVTIPFYLYSSRNLQHIDALISHLWSRGFAVIPIFSTGAEDSRTGQEGISNAMRKYFYHEGELLIDVLINTISYSLGVFETQGALWMDDDQSEERSILVQMNIPVIQAYHTYYTERIWRERIEGVDMMSLISAIYYPEFDGQIDGYPIGVTDEEDPSKILPLREGIETVSKLAYNWAKLRHKKNSEKRVAIIFHNMPPRNDMIGCAAGLDTPASVFNLLKVLESEGIRFDNHYQNGDEIIKEIIDTVSNDTEWLTDEETLSRAIDHISRLLYQRWYDSLTEKSKRFIEKDWGEAPGDFKVIDGVMPVPGVLNEHLFIALQPPRGLEEQAEKIYHSPDISCPHFYIAIYKWIRYQFKADVVIHVGTHGSVEWLPGKEKGLSKDCFPLINIDDLPNLYPYHTTVIGEGIQAKRRTAAVLLNHLEPVSIESGTYDDLSELDALVTQYITAPMNIREKDLLGEQIIKLAQELNLDDDLRATEHNYSAEDYIAELHKWLGVIKHSMVKEGLHIFGTPPEDDRLASFARLLLRLQNGDTPSLPETIASYYGCDYHTLIDEPNHIWPSGKSSIMLRDDFVMIAKSFVEALRKNDYHAISDEALYDILGGEKKSLSGFHQMMDLIEREVIPKLLRTTDELESFRKGINGGFVLPGKGGSPSRGNLDILPTGRNMYGIVPNEVPSKVAYKLGKTLGDQLLSKHLENSGTYPESIAIVLYSGDQMRTHGEDIGEILWLMGLKPKWLSPSSDKVIGLEVISLEELGRPRIDIVSRISGLLRDTFPNLIQLLDDATQLLISLDEPYDMNFIKKHFDEDVQSLLDKGTTIEVATQEATVRVFGCPPGGYGGGVDVLVEAKNWQTDEDLATAAITWAAHAYGREFHGEKCRGNLERQLAKVQATVKNENTIDFDLFDMDDEFIYHGGLIAAVKKCSGKKPESYYGNSSDPNFTVVRNVKEESARVIRSRLLNPIWINGLKAHGYKGAQDVAYNMDNIFGWDATADLIEDWNYEALADHFLGNPENKEWMQGVNPWALREVAAKLLEAAQRGMWNAKEETLDMVQSIYLECEGLMEGDE